MSHTEETKIKISQALLGRKHSEERKKQSSVSHLGQISWNKGKKFPERSKENHHNWRGGTISNGKGYLMTLVPEHPHATKMGYVLTHRLVVEKHLGRYLLPAEKVHHENKIRDDNRIENLKLFQGNGEHLLQCHTVPRYLHWRIHKNYDVLPAIVVEGSILTLGKRCKPYIGKKCPSCNKLFWGRADYPSNKCKKFDCNQKRKYEHYENLPEYIVEGKVISTGKRCKSYVGKKCLWCGKVFLARRDFPTKGCSNSCAQKIWRKTKCGK